MLCGYPPFHGPTQDVILEKVKRGRYVMPGREWSQISPQAKDLVNRMLTFDPKDRISAQQALNHPWIKIFSQIETVEKPLISDAMANLQNFNSNSKLQIACFSYIAAQLTSANEHSKLKSIFSSFDKNGDG